MATPSLIDNERIAAIKATELLDTPPEECFDQYSRLAKRLLGAEMAIVSLVLADRQFYKSCVGLCGPLENKRESPIAFSLCKIGVERRAPLVISDGLNDPEFKDHPAITELKVRSYAGVPLLDEDDHVLGTLCVANLAPRDWTKDDLETLEVLAAAVRNEIRLRKLELQQRAAQSTKDLLVQILETSIAAIAVVDMEGRILFCNRAAERLLGLTPSEVEGRAYDDPEWRSTDVDGGPWPDEDRPFQRVKTTGEPIHDIRHAIEWPDGTRRIISVSGAPLRDHTGQMTRMVFLISDITEEFMAHRRVEKVAGQFQQTFRISPNFAVLCSRSDNKIVEVSKGFLEALKISREQCIGKRLDELEAGFSEDEISALYAADTDQSGDSMELSLRASDDQLRIISVRAQTVEVGDVRYLRITGFDLTNQKAAEQRRATLELQLREAQRTEVVAQLAGGLAHDFNNILTAIIGNAELTARTIDSQHPAQRSLAVIKKAGQRAVDQIRQILSVGDKSTGEILKADVVEVVNECVELFKPQCPESITLRVEQPKRRAAVPATGSRLHQIVMNILTNALQAIGDHNGTIVIRIDPGQQAAPQPLTSKDPVLVEIEDDGPGIDPVHLEQIFEAFFTTRGSQMGSGIGLTLARTLARGFGGDIDVESEWGKGAKFRLWLPRLELGDQKRVSTNDPFGLRSDGSCARILMVDDDEQVLTTGRLMLEQLGFHVSATISPRSALISLRDKPEGYDLLITDNLMPEMTGVELIQTLRSEGNKIPAVLVSGYGTAKAQIARLADNRAVFLPKPFSMSEVTDAIERALRVDQPDS